MVCRLLVLGLGVMTQMSCLLSNPPDYDDPINVVPVALTKNPQLPLIEIDLSDPRTGFEIEVRDDNVEQTLRFRWYLDFDSDELECGCQDADDALPLGDGQYEAQYNLHHSLGVLAKSPRCHRVTVVVTDGEWLENVDGLGCPDLSGEGNRISLDWWLGVRDANGTVDTVSFADCSTLSKRIPLPSPAR